MNAIEQSMSSIAALALVQFNLAIHLGTSIIGTFEGWMS